MSKKIERSGLRTWIEVDSKALAHNYSEIKKNLSPKSVCMSVVKSNAYGHCLVDFAQEMQKLGIDWFGVDSMTEAISLRNNGITKPILVLGHTLPQMLQKASDLDVSITVSTYELLTAISTTSFPKKIKIHIKVDTGMNRQGFLESEIDTLIDTLQKKSEKVEGEGLFTHFAAAKNPAFPGRTLKQVAIFTTWIDAFKKADHDPITHASASGSAIVFSETHFDMVRIGFALYGLWPSKEVEKSSSHRLLLMPILQWKTIIGEVKKIPKGSQVGYDATETMNRESKIAICPIGYWHGYPRALSSVGYVLVHGMRARVVGRVSMDMITIDVTDIDTVAVGDEVTLVGADGDETVSIEEIAELSDTSGYEMVTRINPLIKRLYF